MWQLVFPVFGKYHIVSHQFMPTMLLIKQFVNILIGETGKNHSYDSKAMI